MPLDTPEELEKTLARMAEQTRKLVDAGRALREAGAQAEPQVAPRPVTLERTALSPVGEPKR